MVRLRKRIVLARIPVRFEAIRFRKSTHRDRERRCWARREYKCEGDVRFVRVGFDLPDGLPEVGSEVGLIGWGASGQLEPLRLRSEIRRIERRNSEGRRRSETWLGHASASLSGLSEIRPEPTFIRGMHETLGFGSAAFYLILPIYTVAIWLIAFVSARVTAPNQNDWKSMYGAQRRFSWECEVRARSFASRSRLASDGVLSISQDGLPRPREFQPAYGESMYGSRQRGPPRDIPFGDCRPVSGGYHYDEGHGTPGGFRNREISEYNHISRKPRAPMHAPILGQSDRYSNR
jgi:hypothetical protein